MQPYCLAHTRRRRDADGDRSRVDRRGRGRRDVARVDGDALPRGADDRVGTAARDRGVEGASRASAVGGAVRRERRGRGRGGVPASGKPR